MSTDRVIFEGMSQLIDQAVTAAIERRLAETAERAAERLPQPDRPTFLTIQELADLLRLGTPDADGRRTGGIRTIRQWIAEQRIPYRRANGRVLFLLKEILEWTATRDANGNDGLTPLPPSTNRRGTKVRRSF